MKQRRQLDQCTSWQARPLVQTKIGRPKVITDEYVAFLQELVQHSPKDYGYPFQRWTAAWLRWHLAQELGIKVSDRHVNRLLSRMGLSTRQSLTMTAHELAAQTGHIKIEDLDPKDVPAFNWPFK